MKPPASRSTLHLQMGQEVIYLILTLFILITLILAATAVYQRAEIAQLANRLDEATARTETLQNQNTALIGQFGPLLDTFNGQSSLLNLIDTLRVQLAARDEELTKLRTRVSELDRENASLRKENENLRKATSDSKASAELAAAISARNVYQVKLAQCEANLDASAREVEELRNRVAALTKENDVLLKLTDKPPVISLPETLGYRFPPGEATIDDKFRQLLQAKVVEDIRRNSDPYGLRVIEVIGHTDEQPMRTNVVSNLDRNLLAALQGKVAPSDLTASDNAGLGIIRAAAVAKILRDEERLKGFEILVLSAAQATDSDKLAVASQQQNAPERRRIVIRVRKPEQ